MSEDSPEESQNTARSSRRIFWLTSGGIMILLLLTGATFYFFPKLQQTTESRGNREVKIEEIYIIDQGFGPVRIKFENAPEIPDGNPNAAGLFVRRDGDTLFLGTGNVEVDVEVEVTNGDRQSSTNSTYDGPVIEVVITDETLVYKDDTRIVLDDPEAAAEDGSATVQRTVILVESLDDMAENTEVKIWGSWDGDRVIADVLVFGNGVIANLLDFSDILK